MPPIIHNRCALFAAKAFNVDSNKLLKYGNAIHRDKPIVFLISKPPSSCELKKYCMIEREVFIQDINIPLASNMIFAIFAKI